MDSSSSSLLPSSWTFAALLLASLASLLRALLRFKSFTFGLSWFGPLSHFSLRFSSFPSSSPSPSPSSDCLVSSPIAFHAHTSKVDAHVVIQGKSFRKGLFVPLDKATLKRTRSKGSPALEKLQLQHRNHREVLRSDMGISTCLLDTEMVFIFEKTTSCLPTIFNQEIALGDVRDDFSLGGKPHKVGLQPELKRKDSASAKRSLRKEDKEASGSGAIHCSLTRQKEEIQSDKIGSSSDSVPAWRLPLLQSLQSNPTSPISDSECRLIERSRSFERQFGWDGLLSMRLGLAWKGERLKSGLRQHLKPRQVVKSWSAPKQRLLKTLNVSEATVCALDASWRDGLVSTGNAEGDILLWDFEKARRLSSFHPLGSPVSALCMDTAYKTIIGGWMPWEGSASLGLWDHRSSGQPIIISWANAHAGHVPISGVQSRAHELCIAGGQDLWMHDLRMLSERSHASFSVEDCRKLESARKLQQRLTESTTEEFAAVGVWGCESMFGSEEEEDWEEWYVGVEEASSWDRRSTQENGSGSFVSRCMGLIRSLSS